MNTEHRLLKKMEGAHRRQAWIYPLLSGNCVLAFVWVGLRYAKPVIDTRTEVYIAVLGLLVGLLTFRIIRRKTQKSLREIAASADRSLATHNQLEALVELKDSNHPLKNPQEILCEKIFEQYTPPRWALWLNLLILLLCIELGGVAYQLRPSATPESTAEKPAIPDLVEKHEFAELNLTRPEQEIRLKPMDEVAWSGTGRSSNGFDDFSLSIYLNGEFVRDIPVEKGPTERAGEITLADAFYINELQADPFDVISYHITAHSEINGVRAQEVISIPQFIEVRPFREDAYLNEGGGGENEQWEKILATINKILHFQLVLNKAAYTARASGLTVENPVFLEQIRLLNQEQQQLKDTLEQFLRETDSEQLTAHMTVALRSAEEYMAAASLQLSQLGPKKESAGLL